MEQRGKLLVKITFCIQLYDTSTTCVILVTKHLYLNAFICRYTSLHYIYNRKIEETLISIMLKFNILYISCKWQDQKKHYKGTLFQSGRCVRRN